MLMRPTFGAASQPRCRRVTRHFDLALNIARFVIIDEVMNPNNSHAPPRGSIEKIWRSEREFGQLAVLPEKKYFQHLF